MTKGVFFDLGGTLYSYKNLTPTTVSLLRDLAARLQLDAAFEEIVRHYQEANKEVDRHYAGQPFYLFRDYFEAVFEGFLARLGKPQLRHHFDWFEEHQRVTLLDCMELKADCHEVLEQLADKGLYLSVVSNADENMLHPLIERAELQQWLRHWTSSEAARSCKPDGRFFEVALQKSGLEPDQVLFVGDSLEQDIMGAHKAGMTTVLVSESDQPAPMHIGLETPEPDYRITRLQELLEIIDASPSATESPSSGHQSH